MQPLIALISLPPVIIARGFAIMLLWSWFVTPFGVTEIGLAWAMGLGLFIQFLTPRSVSKKKDIWEELSNIFTAFVNPFFIILIAYLIKLFM